MTALWIILGIFAFLFLLLLCPITLTAGYETQLEAKPVSYTHLTLPTN